MATWQYRMALVPNTWLNKPGNDAASLIYEDGMTDTYFCWEDYQPANVEELCSQVLPESPKKHTDARVWGKSDKHDIYISYEKEKIEEIIIRLDLTDITLDFIKNILNLIKSIDCSIFLIEEKEIINTDIVLLCNKIKKSSAYRFVKDPHDFIENLSKENT